MKEILVLFLALCILAIEAANEDGADSEYVVIRRGMSDTNLRKNARTHASLCLLSCFADLNEIVYFSD